MRNEILLKIIFIIYIILSNKNLGQTLFVDIAHNSIIKTVFFSLVTFLFFFIFYSLLSLKNNFLKFFICILFLLSSFFSQIFYDISGNIINIDDLEIAFLNQNTWISFFLEYKKEILNNIFPLLLGLILIIYRQSFVNFFKSIKVLSIISLCFFIGIFFTSYKRGGFGTQGLPSQLQVLIPLPFVFLSENYKLEKKNYLLGESNTNNVVLIIDESVSFDFFQKALNINDKNNIIFDNLLKSYSLHNCSAQSVFSIMNGIDWTNQNLVIRDNVWKIAKTSGFKTVYLSAQEISDKYQYLQSPDELMYIDDKKFFGHKPNKVRDKILLEELIDELNKGNKRFIVAIKNGSHFPYYSQFNLKKYNLSEKDDEELIYLHSIKENSIEFLKMLISQSPDNFEFLYISDHGQFLKEGSLTHCNSSNPQLKEWEIPVIYYGKKNQNATKLTSNLNFYNFILSMLGYKVNFIDDDKNLLLYGNINQRFEKKVKFKLLK